MSSPFAVGLLVGIAVGGGGTYLALEQPWGQEGEEQAALEIDAGPEAGEGRESKGKRRKGRRGRRNRRGDNGQAELQVIDERIQLSAADRKLSWRGPPVVLPKDSADFSSRTGGRSLDQSEIHAGVNGRSGKISQCIADARGQAELAAKITLKFLVDGQGRPTKIRVQAPSYLLQNGLYECASGAVRSMEFPSTGGHTLVTVPFDLSY